MWQRANARPSSPTSIVNVAHFSVCQGCDSQHTDQCAQSERDSDANAPSCLASRPTGTNGRGSGPWQSVPNQRK